MGLLPHSCLPWTKGSQTHRLTASAVLPRAMFVRRAPLTSSSRTGLASGVLCARCRCRLPGSWCIFWCWKRSPLATLFRERPIACSCQGSISENFVVCWLPALRAVNPADYAPWSGSFSCPLPTLEHPHGQFT